MIEKLDLFDMPLFFGQKTESGEDIFEQGKTAISENHDFSSSVNKLMGYFSLRDIMLMPIKKLHQMRFSLKLIKD